MRNIIIGLSVAGSIAAFLVSQPTHAQSAPTSEKVCILFEDDSFACGTADPVGGWLDVTQPRIIGCIPKGLCDDATPGGPYDPYVQVIGV